MLELINAAPPHVVYGVFLPGVILLGLALLALVLCSLSGIWDITNKAFMAINDIFRRREETTQKGIEVQRQALYVKDAVENVRFKQEIAQVPADQSTLIAKLQQELKDSRQEHIEACDRNIGLRGVLSRQKVDHQTAMQIAQREFSALRDQHTNQGIIISKQGIIIGKYQKELAVKNGPSLIENIEAGQLEAMCVELDKFIRKCWTERRNPNKSIAPCSAEVTRNNCPLITPAELATWLKDHLPVLPKDAIVTTPDRVRCLNAFLVDRINVDAARQGKAKWSLGKDQCPLTPEQKARGGWDELEMAEILKGNHVPV